MRIGGSGSGSEGGSEGGYEGTATEWGTWRSLWGDGELYKLHGGMKMDVTSKDELEVA